MAKVENYGKSIEIKKQQVQSLEAAVEAATSLYQLPRAELPIDYLDVLTAQNELFVAIRDLIETKGEQLSAIVNAYQALGGGSYLLPNPIPQSMQSHHWKFWRHTKAIEEAEMGPKPLPALAAAERGPETPPTPAPPSGPGPFPTPTAGSGPVPPPTPAAASAPLPLPNPAPDSLPEPLPTPGSGTGSGGGKGSGTISNADDPPG